MVVLYVAEEWRKFQCLSDETIVYSSEVHGTGCPKKQNKTKKSSMKLALEDKGTVPP